MLKWFPIWTKKSQCWNVNILSLGIISLLLTLKEGIWHNWWRYHVISLHQVGSYQWLKVNSSNERRKFRSFLFFVVWCYLGLCSQSEFIEENHTRETVIFGAQFWERTMGYFIFDWILRTSNLHFPFLPLSLCYFSSSRLYRSNTSGFMWNFQFPFHDFYTVLTIP